jgi:hypothetical protein
MEGADAITQAVEPAEASRRVDQLGLGANASLEQCAALVAVGFVPGVEVGVDAIDDLALRVIAQGAAKDLRAGNALTSA